MIEVECTNCNKTKQIHQCRLKDRNQHFCNLRCHTEWKRKGYSTFHTQNPARTKENSTSEELQRVYGHNKGMHHTKEAKLHHAKVIRQRMIQNPRVIAGLKTVDIGKIQKCTKCDRYSYSGKSLCHSHYLQSTEYKANSYAQKFLHYHLRGKVSYTEVPNDIKNLIKQYYLGKEIFNECRNHKRRSAITSIKKYYYIIGGCSRPYPIR